MNSTFQDWWGSSYIYDLSDCQPNAAYTITTDVAPGCERRDITPELRAAVGGFRLLGTARFSLDGQQITADTRYWKSTDTFVPTGQKTVIINKTGYAPPALIYLGMGDSFASGEGDNQGGTYYEPRTDEQENLCHLSRRSYPYLIAQQFGLNGLNQTPSANSRFHSVACSGAVIRNIIGGSGIDTTNRNTARDNQFYDEPALNPLGDWLPGRQKQLNFTGQKNPSFITLSIGGNNVGFGQKLLECVASKHKIPAPATCKYAADTTERANVAKEIAAQFEPLKQTYERLAAETQNKTRLYVISYPQFVNPDPAANCALNVRLNSDERKFVYEATKYMNQIIKAAADAAGAHYVDIEHSLNGHNLCSQTEDKDIAFNGLTEGNDKRVPWHIGLGLGHVPGVIASQFLGIGNESYHPNVNGHARMKSAILSKIANNPATFEVCPGQPGVLVCPDPSVTVPLPDSYFGSSAATYVNWLNSPSPIAVAPPPRYTPMTVHDTSAARQIHVVAENFKPNSTLEVIIKSTPTSLGTYIASSGGTLDITLAIPAGVEAGFHTLHVLGANLADEQSDYYEHIFVPGPAGDINGNSIPDTQEACGFTPASNQDNDQDGIDDACDGYIGEVLAVNQPSTTTSSSGYSSEGHSPLPFYISQQPTSNQNTLADRNPFAHDRADRQNGSDHLNHDQASAKPTPANASPHSPYVNRHNSSWHTLTIISSIAVMSILLLVLHRQKA